MPHLPTLLAQMAVILFAARTVGWILRRFRQPQVVGEMAAGILLGPSLLGWLFPQVAGALFPPESLGFLDAVSQVGVVLFMFLMGLELDPTLLRGSGRAAVVTSQTGILVPFLLGTVLGFVLYPRLSPEGVGQAEFVVFLGTAMSITALPVLARILNERGLVSTRVGTLSLACAAVNDVVGWFLLAGVVLATRTDGAGPSLGLALAAVLGFAVLLLLVARPLLLKTAEIFERRGFLSNDLMALVLLLLLGVSVACELAGLHSLFGALLAGAAVPRRPEFIRALTAKIQDITVVLLLPIFFALTGLRTKIGWIAGGEMWGYCALVLLVAIAGKFGGSAVAARMSGLAWREAGALGALMNTRGLVELVILNIGLEAGIISEPLFAMMVLMALVTTFMTTPLLDAMYAKSPEEQAVQPLVATSV